MAQIFVFCKFVAEKMLVNETRGRPKANCDYSIKEGMKFVIDEALAHIIKKEIASASSITNLMPSLIQ